MNKVVFPVTVMILGVITFAILCALYPLVSIGFLLIFHLMLQVGLVWMVFTILKANTSPARASGEKIYGDVELSTRISSDSERLDSAQGHW
jgi:hypothetical protein